jgi:multidrug transporter EmrE-like cation transporter
MKFILVATLTIAGAVLTVIADILLKKGGAHDWRYLTAGIVIYALVAIPVAFAFKYSEFGSLVIAWEAVLLVLSMIVSVWIFNESFTVYRLLAIILAFGAIILAYK